MIVAGRFDEGLAVLHSIDEFAPDFGENLGVEFLAYLVRGDFSAARSVGERLSRALNKSAPKLEVYLALFGRQAGRAQAADTLLSWPRNSRLDTDSPVLGYDFELLHSTAIGEVRDYRWKFRLQKRDNAQNNLDIESGNDHWSNEMDDLFNNPR